MLLHETVIMFYVLQIDLKLVLCSVNEGASNNSTTATLHRQPLTLVSDSVLYALDAATYRHTLHDVRACKTALLKMKRLLQQVLYLKNIYVIIYLMHVKVSGVAIQTRALLVFLNLIFV